MPGRVRTRVQNSDEQAAGTRGTDRPVEALGGARRGEAVGVGEPSEDAHLARVLELDACARIIFRSQQGTI